MQPRSLEDELLEVVFVDLDEPTALRLASDLIGAPARLPIPGEGGVTTNLELLRIDEGIELVNVNVWVFGGGEYRLDVEVNFVPRDSGLPLDPLMDALHRFSVQLAARHGVDTFYAGMEPACDEDTRFFTGPSRGPL